MLRFETIANCNHGNGSSSSGMNGGILVGLLGGICANKTYVFTMILLFGRPSLSMCPRGTARAGANS